MLNFNKKNLKKKKKSHIVGSHCISSLYIMIWHTAHGHSDLSVVIVSITAVLQCVLGAQVRVKMLTLDVLDQNAACFAASRSSNPDEEKPSC